MTYNAHCDDPRSIINKKYNINKIFNDFFIDLNDISNNIDKFIRSQPFKDQKPLVEYKNLTSYKNSIEPYENTPYIKTKRNLNLELDTNNILKDIKEIKQDLHKYSILSYTLKRSFIIPFINLMGVIHKHCIDLYNFLEIKK